MAGNLPHFQQTGQHSLISSRRVDSFAHRPCRMTNLQPQIPQKIEAEFYCFLDCWCLRLRHQKQNINVGKRCEFATPITTNSDNCHPVLLAIKTKSPAGLGDNESDQQIHNPGVSPNIDSTVIMNLELACEYLPRRRQGRFHRFKHRLAKFCFGAGYHWLNRRFQTSNIQRRR